MDVMVAVDPQTTLWAQEYSSDGSPLLLLMGAGASGVTWPAKFLDALAAQHRVIRYDHRDTGRSSWSFDQNPYPISRLAQDALAVLDELKVPAAHLVGMSLGGYLTQMIVADHPERVLSATVFGCSGLGSAPGWDVADLPGPATDLLAHWESMGDSRDEDADRRWKLENWRLLNGTAAQFDAAEFDALERRISAHAGRAQTSSAHARADQSGMERPDELARSTVPFLVIEGSADPVCPPPTADFLTASIGNSHKVTIPEMGHALGSSVVDPVAAQILRHTNDVDRRA